MVFIGAESESGKKKSKKSTPEKKFFYRLLVIPENFDEISALGRILCWIRICKQKNLSSIQRKLFKNTTFPGVWVRLLQIFIAPKDAPQKVALGRFSTNLRSWKDKIPKNAFKALKMTLEKCGRRKKQVSHRIPTDTSTLQTGPFDLYDSSIDSPSSGGVPSN